jgi:hypothetical protein
MRKNLEEVKEAQRGEAGVEKQYRNETQVRKISSHSAHPSRAMMRNGHTVSSV